MEALQAELVVFKLVAFRCSSLECANRKRGKDPTSRYLPAAASKEHTVPAVTRITREQHSWSPYCRTLLTAAAAQTNTTCTVLGPQLESKMHGNYKKSCRKRAQVYIWHRMLKTKTGCAAEALFTHRSAWYARENLKLRH